MDKTRSPARLVLLGLAVIFGMALGLGLFTFNYAEGFAYFSNDPAACVNCHAMNTQFDGWNHSSHKAVAGCNDCHTPHRFPDKWIVKGINGFNHSLAFTLDNYPNPIRIRGFNARIAHENCVDCHRDTFNTVSHVDQGISQAPFNLREALFLESPEGELNCVRCHGNVGHDNTVGN
jgi:cytochrome c nitrite reductase small subunit